MDKAIYKNYQFNDDDQKNTERHFYMLPKKPSDYVNHNFLCINFNNSTPDYNDGQVMPLFSCFWWYWRLLKVKTWWL